MATKRIPKTDKSAGKHKQVLRYGMMMPSNTDPLALELECIKRGGRFKMGTHQCGNGLAWHVREAMKLIWPDMYFHRWTDLIIEQFLRDVPGFHSTGICRTRTGCFGPSSSQKSFPFTRCGLVLFYAKPQGTTGLISSTTIDALRRRIWDYVASSHAAAKRRYPWLPGTLVESKTMLLADASDEDGRSFKNGIVGVATKKGGQWQGLEEFVGLKNDVVFVIADELHFMPVGILDSLANLDSNNVCYFAGLGNLPDTENPLGALCEPKEGWDSLPDTEKSRVFETRWRNGVAIQLIGMDSPNLDFPPGHEPYKGLIGREYIEQCAENYGRESDKFNMFASGKVPRSSMQRTVITRAQCQKFNAMEQVKWGHEKVVRGYGLDAAYSGVGGDRTVGFPFVFGRDVEGKARFWLGPMKLYPGSSDAKMSHSEAIAVECKHECEAHGIPPSHVFFDGTGRSELTSAFGRLWSAQVVPIEFGGMATERPSFTGEKHLDGREAGNVKTCREMFDRFVTELWFAVRTAILFDQMRGLPEVAVAEGCLRKWELIRGAKYCIETKDEMKERGLRSPDIMDAVVAALEGARRLGFELGRTSEAAKRRTDQWLEWKREKQWENLRKEELAA